MKLNVIQGLLLKYWYITIGKIDRIFEIVYWPFLSLLVWGLTSRYILGMVNNSMIVSFFVGGIILWTFFQRAQQDIATYILEDFWSGNLLNLFVSPATPTSIMASISIFSLIKAFITFLFLAFLGWALFSFNMIALNWIALAYFLVNIILFAWILGIFVSSIIFRYGQRIQVFAWSVVWLVQPFSCVFYPLSSLPELLQKVAIWFPLTHVFEGMRSVISTGVFDGIMLMKAVALNLVFLVIVSFYFGNCIDKAKIKGGLVKQE
ncbi:ABC transporter permease [Nanoarchaeota archaeon]